MAFTSHFFMRSGLFYGLLTGATGICAALIIVRGLQERPRPATASSTAARPRPPVWQQAARKQPPAFTVLKGLTPSADATDAEFLSEFRFAGTFFLYSPDTDNPSLRRGVLSYLPENRQEIVSEGSLINQVRVKQLYENRIVLEKDGREGTLFLGGRPSATAAVPEMKTAAAVEPETVRTRFGEQTSEGVWTMEKSSLMEYYEELLEEPERLLQVFDSMRPLYTEEGTIEGYQLQSVGESEFFEAVGFKEGDVVRKVNALAMTNRGRAEFFIRQVVQDRLSAIVIDIEREGDSKRLVYQLR